MWPRSTNRLRWLITTTLLLSLACSGTAFAERVLVGVTNTGVAAKVLSEVAGRVLKNYDRLNVVVADIPSGQATALQGKAGVRYVENDAPTRKLGSSQIVTWGVERIGAPNAWRVSTGRGVRVAVLDTGIDATSFDLRVVGGYTAAGVTGDALVDLDGHGTHVAGTLAALNNHVAMVGVAPDADVYSVKVLEDTGSGSVSALIDGIHWAATHGMQVLNLSLGTSKDSQALREACQMAYDNGLLLVAAAGNSGTRTGNQETLDYPAAYPTVMAVGAVDKSDLRASFSATGAELDIMAPGVDILSMLPENMKGTVSGTSAAAPHVSGVAALVWSVYPTWSNTQVQEQILASARQVGNGDPFLYGRGRVDATAAVGTRSAPAQQSEQLVSSILISSGTVAVGDTVTITVSVVDKNGVPVNAAVVSLSVFTPVGTSFETPGYTGDDGKATFRLRTRNKDGVGAYSLRIQVGKAGFSDNVTTYMEAFTVR